jgi:Ni/Co efflux regulator RcnB
MYARSLRLMLCISCLFCFQGIAQAEKPAWAGKPGNKESTLEASRESHTDWVVSVRFSDDSRRIIGDYYAREARAGRCPPGLAKKHNGCLPPGQAKKWAVGRPLPADLRYHNLPRELLLRLPPPPPQHRYVQIAADILLIAVGTSMVVDAIEDILR